MVGILCLIIGTVVAVLFVPAAAWTDLSAPPTLAIYAYFATLPALWIARARKSAQLERTICAVFLAGMPLVYIFTALRSGDPSWWVELIGFPIFLAIAILGLRRLIVLAIGIALHGLAWDLWHAFYHSAMPSWYAWACLSIDVGVAAYLVFRTVAPVKE
jgi:hypothetical protein